VAGLEAIVRHRVSVQTVQEWARANSSRYIKAGRSAKKQIVDEFAATSGLNRRYLQSLLRRAPAVRSGPIRRPRARRYGDDVRRALERVWKASDRVCARRLVPFLQELVPRLERSGHLMIEPLTRQKLLAISVATADRLLSSVRQREGARQRSCTRPGALLKHQIPVRTFADWDDDRPGFLEADLVAHCGDYGGGEFIHTLTLTDVRTQWTECVALPNRGQLTTVEAVDAVRKRLPFPILGIDSDNGAEFINAHLLRYCRSRSITFTRSRPAKKNDQCRVEQKNGQIVRRYVGYNRHESCDELAALACLYRALRHWQNYFQPSMKLISKERNGARVTRRYDRAQTPYQRLIASGILDDDDREQLIEYYQQLDPVAALQAVEYAQTQLHRAAKDRFSREATGDI
jgi:hypothetical protein